MGVQNSKNTLENILASSNDVKREAHPSGSAIPVLDINHRNPVPGCARTQDNSNVTCNSPKLQTTQETVNNRMDKLGCIYLYNETNS